MPDSQGNDVLAVGIPVTGNVGLAPKGTSFPSPAEGASESLVLSPAFKKVGLLKVDGGPQFAWGASGDPIEFWQEGYSIPSGLAEVTNAFTAAQTDAWIREIISGVAPDENGFLIMDGGGHGTEYVLFTEEIFKNGAIRRRVAPSVQVQTVVEDKSTRGEVLGYAITLKINRSPLIGNGHFGEWVLPPASGGGS